MFTFNQPDPQGLEIISEYKKELAKRRKLRMDEFDVEFKKQTKQLKRIVSHVKKNFKNS